METDGSNPVANFALYFIPAKPPVGQVFSQLWASDSSSGIVKYPLMPPPVDRSSQIGRFPFFQSGAFKISVAVLQKFQVFANFVARVSLPPELESRFTLFSFRAFAKLLFHIFIFNSRKVTAYSVSAHLQNRFSYSVNSRKSHSFNFLHCAYPCDTKL